MSVRGRLVATVGVVGLSVGLALPLATPAAAAGTDCTGERPTPVYVPDKVAPLQPLGYDSAWRLATGRGVTVAVVDSGVDPRNAHLRAAGAVAPGATFVQGVEGWTPDPRGRNDLSGHGTVVASLVGARAVAGSGLVGLAKDATILPVQVFGVSADQVGSDDSLTPLLPTTARLARGIRYAADRGAKVINVSLSLDRPDAALAAAVAYAGQKGALVVASAGDRATAASKADGPRYPAAYPGVLSVTALTSTLGADTVDNVQGDHITVAGPSQGLTAAYKDKGDCVLGGVATSFATPVVAATAALLAQRYPAEGPAMWKYRIESSALRPLADTRDAVLGWGVVSPYDALTMTLDPTRPGPTMPGQAAPPVREQSEGAPPVVIDGDPNATHRVIGLWVAFVAVASAAGLRFVRVLRRHREPA